MLLMGANLSTYHIFSFETLARSTLPLIHTEPIIVAREERKAAKLSVCLNQNKKKKIKCHEQLYKQQ
jgi:hypothetical protein